MDTNFSSSALPSAWPSWEPPRSQIRQRSLSIQGKKHNLPRGWWAHQRRVGHCMSELSSVQAMFPCSSGLEGSPAKVTFLQSSRSQACLAKVTPPQHTGGFHLLGAPWFAPVLFAEPWQGISAHTEYFLDKYKPYFNCCTIILFF